jgi:DNA-binding beta-propeller fold protein YncE
MRRILIGAMVGLAFAAMALHSQRTRGQTVGPLEGGGTLLNTGWRIRPAGKTIPLSTLPMSTALAPGGRMMAVLNGGYLPASVGLLDLETAKPVGAFQIHDGWRGLAFSADGARVYAGNGSLGSVTELAVEKGQLAIAKKIELYPGEPAGVPHLIADIVQHQNRLLVADNVQNKILVVDPVAAKVIASFAGPQNPYAMLLSPDRQTVFVSSWSAARIVEYRVADEGCCQKSRLGRILRRWHGFPARALRSPAPIRTMCISFRKATAAGA